MSHWNHRVVRKTYPSGEVVLDIHEAFYDAEGRVWGVTQDGVSPYVTESFPGCDEGETVEDLKKVLGWMLKACDQPILDHDKIPEPGAINPGDNIKEEDCVPWDEVFGDD